MNPKARIAIALIEQNPCRKVRVEELARRVKLSPSRFRHLFKGEVGMSVTQYCKKMRMEKARRLLETTFEAVKTIAVEAGYSDANFFEREFKRLYGVTPSEYRAAQVTGIAT